MTNDGGIWILLCTHVVFSQESGAELQVVIQVERPPGLESDTESRGGWALGQLLHASNPTEWAMGVLGS